MIDKKALIILAGMVCAAYVSAQEVRVCVAKNDCALTLNCRGSHVVKDAVSGKVMMERGRSSGRTKINVSDDGIGINGGLNDIRSIKILPKNDGYTIVNDVSYEGQIEITSKDNTLYAINSLDIEDYLAGVIFCEISASWPLEAIKAQTVLARTYAYYKIAHPVSGAYDMTDDTACQVYKGRNKETKYAKKIVAMTRGERLTLDGDIAPVFYHAACGGRTERARDAWGFEGPAFKTRRCIFCRASPYDRWETGVSYDELRAKLDDHKIECGEINGVSVKKRSKSGRASVIEIRHSGGITDIRAEELRRALGAWQVKSLKFKIIKKDGGIVIEGRGWGHGVGLCQWGMYHLAKRGWDYKRILRYYFPGAKLER